MHFIVDTEKIKKYSFKIQMKKMFIKKLVPEKIYHFVVGDSYI